MKAINVSVLLSRRGGGVRMTRSVGIFLFHRNLFTSVEIAATTLRGNLVNNQNQRRNPGLLFNLTSSSPPRFMTTTNTKLPSIKYDEALDREITEAEEKIRAALQSRRPTIFHYQEKALTFDQSHATSKKTAFLELVESEVSKHNGKINFLKLDANKYPGIAAIFERKAPFTILLHRGDFISDLPSMNEDVTKIKEFLQDATGLPDAESNDDEFVLWAAAMNSYPAWEKLQNSKKKGWTWPRTEQISYLH